MVNSSWYFWNNKLLDSNYCEYYYTNKVKAFFNVFSSFFKYDFVFFLRFKQANRIIFHEPIFLFITLCLIGLFLLIWFLLGNAWVFSVKNKYQSSNIDSDNYCHHTCYEFAFWCIISFWIVFAVILLFCLGFALHFAIKLCLSTYYNRKIKLSNVR